ncbi:hypothetical protein AK812_SmicGene46651, partial [Symbiodinium microadriaticum]
MGVLRQPPAGHCWGLLRGALLGEDWRRSGHNATMTASDVPTHHFLGGIVDLVLRAWSKGLPPLRGSLFLPSTTGSPCGSISPTGRQPEEGVELAPTEAKGQDPGPDPRRCVAPGRLAFLAQSTSSSRSITLARPTARPTRTTPSRWVSDPPSWRCDAWWIRRDLASWSSVLYADAFFLDGDLRKKPGHLAPGDAVPRQARWQNGWGYVLLLDGHVFYDYGVIRPEHLAPFAARKAFIHVLEIVAQPGADAVWGVARRTGAEVRTPAPAPGFCGGAP